MKKNYFNIILELHIQVPIAEVSKYFEGLSFITTCSLCTSNYIHYNNKLLRSTNFTPHTTSRMTHKPICTTSHMTHHITHDKHRITHDTHTTHHITHDTRITLYHKTHTTSHTHHTLYTQFCAQKGRSCIPMASRLSASSGRASKRAHLIVCTEDARVCPIWHWFARCIKSA